MGRNDFSNLGDEIRDSVQSAINRGDFSELTKEAREFRDSVNQAIRAVQKENASHTGTSTASTAAQKQNDTKVWTDGNGREVKVMKPNQRTYQALAKMPLKPVGKVGSVLFTVFGSIAFGIGLILLLVFLSVGVATGNGTMFALILALGLPFAVGGGAMLTAGRVKAGRISRMNQYAKLVGTKGYAELKELAERTGRSVRYIVKDLKQMIRLGMFPEGHLDDKKTCFIMDNKTHQMYLEMKEAQEIRTQEAQRLEEAEGKETAAQRAAKATAREGREYVVQIRQANASIRTGEITKKLDQISNILDKIFLYIEGHPEKLDEIRKCMDYYLPTTLKLVTAYREFDAQPVQGDNITSAKKEIEETLDTINVAFARLFDNLYADTAMDISTDIDVLEAMFAQEGLTGHSFKK